MFQYYCDITYQWYNVILSNPMTAKAVANYYIRAGFKIRGLSY